MTIVFKVLENSTPLQIGTAIGSSWRAQPDSPTFLIGNTPSINALPTSFRWLGNVVDQPKQAHKVETKKYDYIISSKDVQLGSVVKPERLITFLNPSELSKLIETAKSIKIHLDVFDLATLNICSNTILPVIAHRALEKKIPFTVLFRQEDFELYGLDQAGLMQLGVKFIPVNKC